MLKDRPTAPPSPPTSPRMSDPPAKANPSYWPHPSYITTTSDGPQGLQRIHPAQLQSGEEQRPSLRTYKSFPYSLGPSTRFQHDAPTNETAQHSGPDYIDRVVAQGPHPAGSADLQPATYGGSAPTSPAGRLTPHSGDIGHGDEPVDDDDLDMVIGEDDDGEEKPLMTAAELRAHKRKMKRFRLTHNQTRFLMSEFARQAHPDAAHRERLSREIPGLSPRQVQVWFQNRRAKLKRLTTDDRERMMRSRALPADFDMTQALHSGFGAPPPSMGTPMPSPGAYSHFGGDIASVRPLTLDTLRRVPDYEQFAQQQYVSPTGISPAMGAFAFTPPQSATDTVSPGSAASDMSSFGYQNRHTQESPRRVPYGYLGAGFGSGPPQMPRLHMHDRFSRPMGETASSPLRSSMSYSALGSSSMTQSGPTPAERAASFSEHSSTPQERAHQHRSLTNPTTSGAGPFGLGFSYGQVPSYQSSEHQQSQQPPSNTSASGSVGFPAYRRDSANIAGLPAATYPPYQSSAFATSQMPQYSQYSPSYPQPPTFTSPYQPSQPHHPRQPPHAAYTPTTSQPHQFPSMGGSNDGEPPEESDNTGGGSGGTSVQGPHPY